MQRRTTLLMALSLAAPALTARAASIPVKLYKSPTCHCCDLYAKHLEDNGFDVALVDTTEMASIKQKYGVPEKLEGCHTAIIRGYVVEGLVPAQYVQRLLKEHPNIVGLALPGMPTGAPGMPGAKSEPLTVFVLDGSHEPKVFATF